MYTLLHDVYYGAPCNFKMLSYSFVTELATLTTSAPTRCAGVVFPKKLKFLVTAKFIVSLNFDIS